MKLLLSILRGIGKTLVYMLGIAAVLWAAGALFFDLPVPGFVRILAALVWLGGVIAAWCFLKPRCYARMGISVGFALILGWWLMLSPRQERDWKPEVTTLARATVEGDTLTVFNVRNTEYRSETDYTPRYETRTYDLKRLQGLDLIVSKWKWCSGVLGHPMLSFDFGGGNHLVFSIEIRPEKGESFRTAPALFRQFEIIYIPADERDVIGGRAAFRSSEDVYLYRIKASPELIRETLLEYVARLNQLHDAPEWYNLINANCTTSVRAQSAVDRRMPWDIRLLINGFVDKMLYDRGALDTAKPFAELERAAHINQQAAAAYADPGAFSEAIRRSQ